MAKKIGYLPRAIGIVIVFFLWLKAIDGLIGYAIDNASGAVTFAITVCIAVTTWLSYWLVKWVLGPYTPHS